MVFSNVKFLLIYRDYCLMKVIVTITAKVGVAGNTPEYMFAISLAPFCPLLFLPSFSISPAFLALIYLLANPSFLEATPMARFWIDARDICD